MIVLTPVHDTRCAEAVLWELLHERPPEANISHMVMPSPDQHRRFVHNHPYRVWYIIWDNDLLSGIDSTDPIGACLLTNRNEVGIAILKKHQRHGYALNALRELLSMHEPLEAQIAERQGHFIANVSPYNEASINLFKAVGGVHIQNTYRIDYP